MARGHSWWYHWCFLPRFPPLSAPAPSHRLPRKLIFLLRVGLPIEQDDQAGAWHFHVSGRSCSNLNLLLNRWPN